MAHEIDRFERHTFSCYGPWRHLPDVETMHRESRKFNRPLREAIHEMVSQGTDARVFCYLPSPSGGLAVAYVW